MSLFNSRKEQEQRDRIVQYKKALNSEEGKHVMLDLMNKFHILNTHRGDAYSEGQRSVVLYLIQQCNIDLNKLDKLIKGESENEFNQ